MAQDSGGPEAVDKWLDRASPTYRCVVDPTHEISSLFGWVNVPAAAWIDEDGQIVRSNEGVYPAEMVIGFGLGKVRLGDNSFADATRDWIERGADSEHVWSSSELAERLKPADDDTRLAEADFQAGVALRGRGRQRACVDAFRRSAAVGARQLELPAPGMESQGEDLCRFEGAETDRATCARTPTRASTTPRGYPARTITGSPSPSGCGRPRSGGSSNWSAARRTQPTPQILPTNNQRLAVSLPGSLSAWISES